MEPKEKKKPEEPTKAPEETAKPVPEPTVAEKPKKAKKEKEDKADRAVEDLRTELEKLQKELEETRDQYQRMLAEYANYKRRTEQEKEQLGQFTRGEMLKALLPSLDNLERAVAAPAGEEYKKGVDMVIDQLHQALKGMGLTEIPAENQPFDPEVHHAVMREDADGVEPDTVTQVFQKGYKYGDKVLRPAMVKVAN